MGVRSNDDYNGLKMMGLEGVSIVIPEPREKPLATRRREICPSLDDLVEIGRQPVPQLQPFSFKVLVDLTSCNIMKSLNGQVH